MKNPQNWLLSWIITCFFVILISLLALDSFGNPQTTEKFLRIASSSIIIPFLLTQFLTRYFIKTHLRPEVVFLSKLALPLLAVITTGLSIYWQYSEANAVFELTKLHPEKLMLLVITLTPTLLINQADAWWKSHWKKVVAFTPLVGFLILCIASLWQFNIFKEIVKEDNIVEMLQFAVLFVGSMFNFLIARQFFLKNQKLKSCAFILSGLLLFLVAGDEISWGQRLLGLETSEQLKELNRQEEITIHNLHAIEWLIVYGYTIASAVGVLSYWIASAIGSLKKYAKYLPQPELVGYYLFPLIFFFQQIKVQGGIWHSWSEPAELFLYAGLVLWTISAARSMGFKLGKR